MICNQCDNIRKKKVKVFIFTIATVLLISAFEAFIVSAEIKQVTEQEMTFDIGDGKERTGIYTGPLENYLPHGRGKFEWINSNENLCVYEGDFAGGVLQGQGTMTIHAKNGDWIYTGEFADGEPQGELERVGGSGLAIMIRNGKLPSMIRSSGILGFVLWLMIALVIFLVMVWVASVVETIKRYSRYRAARLAGTLTPGTSFWKMSGAAFAELAATSEATPHGDGNIPYLVGKKPFFSKIMGLITIILVFDVWWAIGYGFNFLFLIIVGSTIWEIVDTVKELRKSISVADNFVLIDGTAFFYDYIIDVSVPKKEQILIKINNGLSHKLSIINAQAVCDAIMANKARANGGVTAEPVCGQFPPLRSF